MILLGFWSFLPYCNLGSDPFWSDVGLGEEISTKNIKNKFSWELAPDPEAYQIFSHNSEKHENGSED